MATKKELAEAAKETVARQQQDTEASTALMVPQTDGVQAMALLSEEAFNARLASLKAGQERIARVQREYMEVDVDYGLIPNTPKPTLFKSGAEKLAQLYGLAARIESQFIGGDNEKTPPLTYDSQCFLHVGSFAGPIVAVGHGTANSWEKRYRREGDKVCPNCSQTAIIKSKPEYGGGWYCFPKKGGCGARYNADDPAIGEQSGSGTGDIASAFDLGVTLMKMAEKRSFVDAVLRATATSGLFTQDVAEEPPEMAQRPAQEPAAQVAEAHAAAGADYIDGEVEGDPFDPATVASKAKADAVVAAVVEATGGTEIGEDGLPIMGPSNVENVERGGHTANASSAQIGAVRSLAEELGWGAKRLIAFANNVFDTDMAIPADGRVARGEFTAYLDKLSADKIASLIGEMEIRVARERQEADGHASEMQP